MKRNTVFSKNIQIGIILLVLASLVLACQAPQPKPTAPAETQPVDLQATVEAMLTAQAPTVAAPTEAPLPTSTVAVPTEPAPSEYRYQGFMALVNGQITALDFDGTPLGFSVPLPNTEWLSSHDVSISTVGILYHPEPGGVPHLAKNDGSDTTLDYMTNPDGAVRAVISQDGNQVAWVRDYYGSDAPGTELWVANTDGTNLNRVDQILPEDNTDRWLVLFPLYWTKDGKLIYATQLSGIGGYILYGGWNGLRLYDPATGGINTLVSDEERLGLCVNSVSDDVTKVALGCNPLRIRVMASGAEISLPILAEQNTAGSAAFSPDNQWVVYAIARNNYENERGQVVVAAADGSTAPVALTTVDQGFQRVQGWINAETLIFSAYENASNAEGIYRINRDGSENILLTNGHFLGFIPAE